MKTIYEFVIKELLQFKRDRKMLAVVFMAPNTTINIAWLCC